jgi:ATP-dependent protease HslVU (ClpYQ) peptidase subunit
MTCVVGIAINNKVYLAGDSAGTAGLEVEVRATKKVFYNKEFLMGYCGSFRIGQVLQYIFKPPKLTQAKKKDLMRFMVHDFVSAMRMCIHSELKDSEEDIINNNGPYLVGVCGRLFEVQEDFQVSELLDGCHAIGAGGAYALGSLHSTKGQDTEKRLNMALDAAVHYNASVRKPYHILSNE